MSASPGTVSRPANAADDSVADDLSLLRLNLLRAGYAFMGIGLVVVKWPLLISHPDPWPLYESVVTCMLVAMSALALLGLRHPARLLPILLFESAWKLLWLTVVAVPALAAGDVDAPTREVVVTCSLVVVILAVVPWRFTWRRYLAAEGERWHR
jgi:hypothetical protein